MLWFQLLSTESTNFSSQEWSRMPLVEETYGHMSPQMKRQRKPLKKKTTRGLRWYMKENGVRRTHGIVYNPELAWWSHYGGLFMLWDHKKSCGTPYKRFMETSQTSTGSLRWIESSTTWATKTCHSKIWEVYCPFGQARDVEVKHHWPNHLEWETWEKQSFWSAHHSQPNLQGPHQAHFEGIETSNHWGGMCTKPEGTRLSWTLWKKRRINHDRLLQTRKYEKGVLWTLQEKWTHEEPMLDSSSSPHVTTKVQSSKGTWSCSEKCPTGCSSYAHQWWRDSHDFKLLCCGDFNHLRMMHSSAS